MTPSMLWNFHCLHDYVTDILKKNGGTFMYKGPCLANKDMLITSDPANFHHISATNFRNYPKGPDSREIFDVLGDSIFNSDDKLWEFDRKTTISVFRNANFLKLVEKTIWNNMEKKLMPVLEVMSERGSTTDLQDIFQRLTFDSSITLLVGHDPETLSVDLPYNKFEAILTKAEDALFNRHFLPKWFWKLLNQLRLGNEKYLSGGSRLSDELFYKFIRKKRERLVKEQVEDDSSLLTGFLMEYNKDGSLGNSEKFIKDTLVSLLVAGRDTTSSALTFFFHHLTRNPIVKDIIRKEIHAQLGMEEGEKWKSFGAKELEKLAYLHGALCEALRLTPPFPANQKVSVEADTLPSGHQISRNTKIILYPYAMGRMETVWGEDCLEFKPERWLSEKGGIKRIQSYKFTAFHAGPRACIGKEMSLIQMKVVVATIIYNYDFEDVNGHPSTLNGSVFLQLKHGLRVKLTRRSSEVKAHNLLCAICRHGTK